MKLKLMARNLSMPGRLVGDNSERWWRVSTHASLYCSAGSQFAQVALLLLHNMFSNLCFFRTRMENLIKLDATDRRILLALDADPRVPTTLLAQRLKLARGTVQSRLDRLESSGALRPHSTRVLPEALGRSVGSTVRAELDQQFISEAIEALRRIPEVLECFAPAGDTDLLLRVVARTPDDLYRVSEEIRLCPGIRRTSTSLFLRKVIPYRMTELLKE